MLEYVKSGHAKGQIYAHLAGEIRSDLGYAKKNETGYQPKLRLLLVQTPSCKAKLLPVFQQ